MWLIRRANRAMNHLAIIGQTERQLLQYGLRAKTFLALRAIGQRASQRGEFCSDIVERFKQRIQRAKAAITKRSEAHRYLSGKAADAIWLRYARSSFNAALHERLKLRCDFHTVTCNRKLESMESISRASRDSGGGGAASRSPTKSYQWALNLRAYQADAVRQLTQFAEKASRVYAEHIELYHWLQAKVQIARQAISRRHQGTRRSSLDPLLGIYDDALTFTTCWRSRDLLGSGGLADQSGVRGDGLRPGKAAGVKHFGT